MEESVEIFFSYSRKDETLRDELAKQLRHWEREGLITVWHDRNISAGREWTHEIHAHLNSAHIILLLLSPDFLASDYCYSVEVKRAMERHEAGEARVIPVILRPVIWQDAPFGKLQALPTDAKPITDPGWSGLDNAFFNVAQGLHKVILEVAELTIVSQKVNAMGRLAELSAMLRDYLAVHIELTREFGSDILYPVSRVQEALVILADIMGKVAKANDSREVFSNVQKAEELLKSIWGSCVKCRMVRSMSNIEVVKMKNGKPALRGECPICKTGMYKLSGGDGYVRS